MQYIKNPPLLETGLLADPLAQLQAWLADAQAAGMIDPSAMTLATVADGQPSARIVLFKGLHQGGLTFFTNYEGRKGRELEANPKAALVFWWDKLERQVRIEGAVEKLPEALSREYFHSRPRASQLGALTSHQSEVIASRTELEDRLERLRREHENQPVPHPPFWGGYCLMPRMFEFWHGRADRLHDRLVYRKAAQGWRIERLEP